MAGEKIKKPVSASWGIRLSKMYQSGDTLTILMDKFNGEFKVEITPGSGNKNTLVLKPDDTWIKPGIRALHADSKFNNAALDAAAGTDVPCLYLACVYAKKIKRRTRLRMLLPNTIRVPIKLPRSDAEEVEVTLSGTEMAEEKIRFMWRRRTKEKKFADFLHWQSTLVYGPARAKYIEPSGYFRAARDAWDTKSLQGVLQVSASGRKDTGMVCSPFVSQFLAYWLNFHQYFTPAAGQSRDLISQKAGGSQRVNGYGDFLEKQWLIVSKKAKGKTVKQKLENWHWLEAYNYISKDGKPGDIYACASGGHAWLLVVFGDGFNFPRKYIYGLRTLPGEDHEKLCDPGIYRIHASGPGDSEVLWQGYSRTTPSGRLKKGVNSLKAAIEKYRTDKKKGFHLAPSGVTYSAIADNLENALKKMEADADCKGIWVYNATSLITMNGRLYTAEVVRTQYKKKLKKKVSYKQQTVRIDLGINELGSHESRKLGDIFQIWKVKDVLDPDTGMLKPGSVTMPIEMWLGGTKVPVDLTGHDCRPIINLPPSLTIEGTVKDQNTGKAVQGATVRAVKSSAKPGEAEVTAATDTTGYYCLTSLDPGKYTVEAVMDGYSGESAKLSMSNAQPSVTQNLTIACLRFNGRLLRWGSSSWPAVSGREGSQTADHQREKGVGPIPEGMWWVRQDQYQKMPDRNVFEMFAAELGFTAWRGGESAWGKNRIWLRPVPGTETYGRSGFSIHGGDEPGSAGCIDLTTHMPDFVQKFLAHKKDMLLIVDYTAK